MTDKHPAASHSRRKVLRLSASAAGAAALVTLAPFIGQALIQRKTTENGEIVDIDVSQLTPGTLLTVDWKGQPVWVVRRTPEMIRRLAIESTSGLVDPNSEHSKQPAYVQNDQRSIKPDFFIAMALCPHLGCTPAPRFLAGNIEGMPERWNGGFLCPCHTSTFDLAGRAHLNREAKKNLQIPPHYFLTATQIRIGEDPSESA